MVSSSPSRIVLAAAGQVAIDQMIARLSEDHKNAKKLAEGIANTLGLYVDPGQIKTNIVYFDLVRDSLKQEEFLKRVVEKGVKFLSTGPSRFRMVTHHGITAGDIDAALTVLEEVMKQ